MKNRGVILVLLLLIAGLAAATIAIWHQYQQTRQALGFWGPESVHLIGRAPSVELIALRSGKPDETGLAEKTHGDPPTVDISGARGLIHFRRSLLEDENFDWDADAPDATAVDWEYAVRFAEDEASIVLLFDLGRHLVAKRSAEDDRAVLTPKMAEGLARFFKETLAGAVE